MLVFSRLLKQILVLRGPKHRSFLLRKAKENRSNEKSKARSMSTCFVLVNLKLGVLQVTVSLNVFLSWLMLREKFVRHNEEQKLDETSKHRLFTPYPSPPPTQMTCHRSKMKLLPNANGLCLSKCFLQGKPIHVQSFR